MRNISVKAPPSVGRALESPFTLSRPVIVRITIAVGEFQLARVNPVRSTYRRLYGQVLLMLRDISSSNRSLKSLPAQEIQCWIILPMCKEPSPKCGI